MNWKTDLDLILGSFTPLPRVIYDPYFRLPAPVVTIWPFPATINPSPILINSNWFLRPGLIWPFPVNIPRIPQNPLGHLPVTLIPGQKATTNFIVSKSPTLQAIIKAAETDKDVFGAKELLQVYGELGILTKEEVENIATGPDKPLGIDIVKKLVIDAGMFSNVKPEVLNSWFKGNMSFKAFHESFMGMAKDFYNRTYAPDNANNHPVIFVLNRIGAIAKGETAKPKYFSGEAVKLTPNKTAQPNLNIVLSSGFPDRAPDKNLTPEALLDAYIGIAGKLIPQALIDKIRADFNAPLDAQTLQALIQAAGCFANVEADDIARRFPVGISFREFAASIEATARDCFMYNQGHRTPPIQGGWSLEKILRDTEMTKSVGMTKVLT